MPTRWTRGLKRLRYLVVAVLALAFVAGTAVPSFAVGGQTGNLTGTFIDQATKTPLAGVNVVVASPAARYTAKTDKNGFFSINGLTVDTYTVSASLPGYEPFVISGVTIQGDQTVALDPQALTKSLTVIGRTRARAQSNVFQPSQTIDAVTISGNRAVVATGKAGSLDEQALALSAPGVQLVNRGAGIAPSMTIRGGLSNETGYQFDGIPFQEPYLNRDAANGIFNGLGSLQVVAGAGDPSQGNVGSGILNFTVKRGTSPAFGLIDLETRGPGFGHQAGFEYGFATPNGRFSNYTSYAAQRFSPIYGYSGFDAATQGVYNGITYQRTDDLINNFVFKFGRDNNQQLQFLYRRQDIEQYGDLGGLQNRIPFQLNPVSLTSLAQGTIPSAIGKALAPQFGGSSTAARNQFFRDSLIGFPYLPGPGPLNEAEQTGRFPLNLTKLEYDNNLNSSTYLAARWYTYSQLAQVQNYYSTPVQPVWSETGGIRSGIMFELTKTLGEKHTVTIGGKNENAKPIRDEYRPDTYTSVLVQGPNYTTSGSPSFYDFLNPVNGACPVANACYLANNGYTTGGVASKIPLFGVRYNKEDYQTLSAFFRDQWAPTRRLKFDLGFRVDHVNFKEGANPWNPDLNNPTDVDPSAISTAVRNPTVWQPRAAGVYQLGLNDSVRFGYGRSVIFANAQTFGTPASLYGYDPRLDSIPVLPGTNTADPKTWTCGSGYNTSRVLPDKSNLAATGGGFFRCTSYGQQYFWFTDQTLDAPDVGNNTPPTYSNYDLTLQHQFRNGIGIRLTGYAKRGFNLPVEFLVNQFTDPVTGAITGQVFYLSNVGLNKTSGVEFGLSLPDRPVGFSGYLSATYTNVLNVTPPLIAGEDQLPLVSKASLALNNVYRAGYVSPFVVNTGVSYRTRNGFRFNPVFNYDRGYPIGAGFLTPSGARYAQGSVILGQYQTIAQTNFDFTSWPAYRSQYFENAYTPSYRGNYTATQFVDPVNPGNYFHPYIAATRGTAEAATAGGVLSKPRLYANMSIEYQVNRNTFGVFVSNIFGNVFSEPSLNPLWQPVATGVGGPLTGQRSQANPNGSVGALYYPNGVRNLPTYVFSDKPYIEIPNNPTTVRLYYQLAL